jgi:ABC-2 type transport system ATP-binding protein
MALLQFVEATKRYKGKTALDALSLKVEAGEIYGFLGPNGAGKTTALHLAIGFARVTSGGGELAGRPFGDKTARADVGFVPDAPVFFTGSAMETMELACTLNGRSFPQLRERCRATLRTLDLPEGTRRSGNNAQKFSRGMQQRLALAQAFALRPKVLLLDEPTSALDPPSVLAVRGLLEQARQEGTAIFFSSHQLTEVEQLSDRIGFLRSGRLVKTGRLDELLAERAVVEVVVRGVSVTDAAVTRWGGRLVRPGSREVLLITAAANQRELIESLWVAGAEMVSVTRQRQSLEELFAAEGRSFAGSGPQDGKRQGQSVQEPRS